MKVLVATGTMKGKKFTRLYNILDELCVEGILDGNQLIAQVGAENYQSKYYKCFEMIADQEFKKLISESDLIICHGGTGTVTSCLKLNKKVIVFPRRLKYDEHLDDNQIELAEMFRNSGYIMVANDKEQLVQCIKSLDTFIPKPFISNNNTINQIIIDFIEGK